MAYRKKTWRFQKSNEYQFVWAGKYGARGEHRAKRKKATPEQIAKQNQRNRENKVRRLLKANFTSNDYWVTLTHPKGTRLDKTGMMKEWRKFITKLRRIYHIRGQDLKWVRRMEIGAQGGIHIHLVLNRLKDGDTLDAVREAWEQFGQVYIKGMYEQGGFQDLAAYIVKQPEQESEVYEQLSMFDEQEQKAFLSFSTSRNLERPEPVEQDYKVRTMRKTMEQATTGTLEPSPGYYIEPDSVSFGINPFNGMSYLTYTETLIDPGGGG